MSSRILPLLVYVLLQSYLTVHAFAPLSRIENHGLSVAKSTVKPGVQGVGVTVGPHWVSRPECDPLRRQRQSVAPVQTMGLFGLGGLEIAVIIIGVGVVLGPERILEMVRSSGDTAEEYKKELSRVPDEFKKGMEEGEMEARSRKAKVIKKVVAKEDTSASDE
jgi:Sec-independent protein translocase protein TatA